MNLGRLDQSDRGEIGSDDRPFRQRSISIGALAGLVGIGCCVYPVVLVLLGLSTAAAAVDLGNRLFDEWGWAFKSAGVLLAAAAIWVQRRRARACDVDARPRLLRSIAVVVAIGVATYSGLYALTSWLGTAAD
ncbi:MAG: hypothetical protein WEA54_00915 [Actinomycetota bacterium]